MHLPPQFFPLQRIGRKPMALVGKPHHPALETLGGTIQAVRKDEESFGEAAKRPERLRPDQGRDTMHETQHDDASIGIVFEGRTGNVGLHESSALSLFVSINSEPHHLPGYIGRHDPEGKFSERLSQNTRAAGNIENDFLRPQVT